MDFFAYSRTALKHGLLSLGFLPGQKILVPNYICDALVQPILQLDCEPVYYQLDSEFQPDWTILESRPDLSSCRAIIMVHFFGQPQNISRFQVFCQTHDLILIEDNAHGFGGSVQGQLMGTFGDIGISSPRKILNTYTGGILYIKGIPKLPKLMNRHKAFILNRLLRAAFEKSGRLKIFALRLTKGTPNFNNPLAFKEPTVNDKIADKHSSKTILKILKSNTLEEIARERREKWEILDELVIDFGLKPVFKSLDPNSSPWVYPAYGSYDSRKKFVKLAIRKHVIPIPWPALPRGQIRKDTSLKDRWKTLVCIPLSYDKKMIKSLKK